MGIPFEVPAEGMEDHEKTGSEVHRLILFKKHTGDNTVYGLEKAVKEGAVIEEKVPELFVDGKDTMAVWDIDELKGHGGSAFHGIFDAAGRTEAAVAAERDKLLLTAGRAAVHGTAKGRITAVDHLIDILYLGASGGGSVEDTFLHTKIKKYLPLEYTT